MADKLIKIGTEGLEEFNPISTSAGAADAGKAIILNSSGKIDETILPTGIGADTKVCVAFETLAAGDVVNLFDDSGTLKARKADASAAFTKSVHGFVKANVTSAQNATVYFEGTISGLTGLTIGAKYFLSATAGTLTTTAPTTAGHIMQYVGVAVSATELSFEAGEPIKRA